MSVSVENIRPVEVLWLRNEFGDAYSWDRENALRAVLMDLSVRGLLEPEDDEESFEPTDVAVEEPLRSYEESLLEAIEGEDDQEAMVDATYGFDFHTFFVENGVLEEVEKSEERGLPLIPLSWYSYTSEWTETVETDLFEEIMREVEQLETDLQSMFERSAVRSDLLPMLFAFPEVDWVSGFDFENIDDIVVGEDDVDDVDVDVERVSSNVGGMGAATTAAIAASSAGACAAASSACAASAAGACSAGAAGGAAAGAAGGV